MRAKHGLRQKVTTKKLVLLERKVFGPVHNMELRTFERKKNEDLYKLYEKSNIQSYLGTKIMEWFGHV